MAAAFALLPPGDTKVCPREGGGAPKGRMRAAAAPSGKHTAQAHPHPALRATFSRWEKGYALELY